MASYQGTFTFSLQATFEGGFTFTGSGTTPWTVHYDLRDDMGVLQGYFPYASGLVHVTVADALGPFESYDTGFSLPEFIGTVAPDSTTLPLPSYAEEFGDAWTHAITVSSDRTRLTYSGGVVFDEVVDGLHISGAYTATAELLLDTTYPRFDIQPLQPDLVEGDATGATFLVTRSGNTEVAASVAWWVALPSIPVSLHDTDWLQYQPDGLEYADFPSVPGYPFAMPSGSLDFAAGETTRVLEVVAFDDFHHETTETFRVNIEPSRADGFLGQRATAIGRILDNDAPAFVSILPVVDEQTEGPDAALTYRLHREGGIEGPASLWYAVSRVTPSAFDDTVDFSGLTLDTPIPVTFPAGVADIEIRIPILDDSLVERPETFRIALSTPSPGMSIDIGEADGTVLSDDPVSGVVARVIGTDTAPAATPAFYTGPAKGLDYEFIAITPDDLVISTAASSWFLRSGSGNDAIAVASGNNVIDAGTGSNFLTGGHGADTFFLDIRGLSAPVWSSVINFGSIDTITIWGLAADTPFAWQEWQGAAGHQGLTLVTTGPNGHVAALTIAGWTLEMLDYWRMGRHFGHDPASGSDFMTFRHDLFLGL